MRGDWDSVNWFNFWVAIMTSTGIGVLRVLQALRKGRTLKWLDLVLEPALAVTAGMMVWGLLEISGAPEVLKTVIVSLAAWGGPHTIRKLEVKYLGPLVGDTGPTPLEK